MNRAVEAVREREARQGRLGVFWHTQGAGKSCSMVMFTRKVHRKLGGNFTFLVLTDRDDLDNQIQKTFAGCGVVDHDCEPCRAGSGRHLSRLLTEHKSHVFSLIQKFNRDVDPERPTPNATTSSSSPTRRTAPSTAPWLSTCATPCPTPRTSASPARRCSRKAEKLRVDQWREKESTRDAVHIAIHDFLCSDQTGLPTDSYTDDDIAVISDNVYRHVFRAYPEVPSPYYERAEAA